VSSNAKNISDVLNLGISLSEYELIARMDQDDISLPGRFASQLAYMTANPTVAMVGGQVLLIDPKGVKIGTAHYPISSTEIFQLLPYKNCFAHPAVMYRKTVVNSVGGYLEDFPFAEDYFLWLRLSKVAELGNINEYVLKYRIHGSQISTLKFKTQMMSCIGVMATGFQINPSDFFEDFQKLKQMEKREMLKSILEINVIRKNQKFRSAIALMYLRRGKTYTDISFTDTLKFLQIIVRSDPLVLFKEYLGIMNRFLRY
jgi:hypothetical protein